MLCTAAEKKLGIQIFSMEPPARVEDRGQCPAGGCPRALPWLSVCALLTRPRRSSSCHRGRGKEITPAAHVPCTRHEMPFITAQEAAGLPDESKGDIVNLFTDADSYRKDPTPRVTSSTHPHAGSRFMGSKGISGGGPRLRPVWPNEYLPLTATACTGRMLAFAFV